MINHLLTNLLGRQIFGTVRFASAGRSASSRSDCLRVAGIAVIDSIFPHLQQAQTSVFITSGSGRGLPRWNSQAQGPYPCAILKKSRAGAGPGQRTSAARPKTANISSEFAAKFTQGAKNLHVVLRQRGNSAGSSISVDPPNIARQSI